ncbi:helix-turn-helix domain-containing protein [Mycobacteroides abscessus]|uniref:helix-turn-helix domain-containing protein n=1 Tax=Mycobacteroides abscessus TaxID=36809 RepID=UPI00092BBB09|nr:helix-turn-helix domain-containing protein [Mycobacteroides abscessus]SHT29420.1 chromosome partitioning protein [Mycobacteroides abscessus subsp. abscessus]SHX01309.1 chromosome partitioning protein [Mycobacteroides abscessus subsp. abscessus]SKG94863.1 chromosome partitioning protein [Mycobacteroides abscessus subsp. abscessus]SKH50039.1 chromosome partitioning protein [Mycobacteroides abscessus subsp. abscessus]SKH66407.1 chromosome partitioning protein [Mycobacteroides abscessus subsp. 
MATQFTTSDHLAAQRATAALPQAARAVAGRTKAAVALLDNLEAACTPGEALAALARSRRARAGIEHAEGAMLLLLVRSGASHRSLAAALGIGRSTVDRLIAQARADQEARNG